METQGAKSGKELIVERTCVVEESADDALNPLDAFCGEMSAVGFHMGELGGLAKDNFMMLVQRESWRPVGMECLYLVQIL